MILPIHNRDLADTPGGRPVSADILGGTVNILGLTHWTRELSGNSKWIPINIRLCPWWIWCPSDSPLSLTIMFILVGGLLFCSRLLQIKGSWSAYRFPWVLISGLCLSWFNLLLSLFGRCKRQARWLDSSYHIQTNVSERRGIIWDISIHSIRNGEVFFQYSLYISKGY